MSQLLSAIEKAETIAIGGHVRPDGDCIGSCMGLFRYIKKNYPDKQVCVYVEEISDAFDYLKEEDAFYEKPSYDLFISLDCGDEERLGDAQKVMEKTPYVLNIDHHITNTKFGNENVVKEASSTCEILYGLMEEEKLDAGIASALYTGIVHDTGVFKHSNTTKETMEIAGKLIAFGIPFGKIIDDSFYRKTYKQLQIMGRCLMESVRIMDGRCLFSIVRQNVMKLYEAKPSDLDGIIDEMRTTEGVEVAILQFSYKFFCFVQCVKFSYVKQTQIIGHNAMNFKSDAFLQVEIYNGKLIRLRIHGSYGLRRQSMYARKGIIDAIPGTEVRIRASRFTRYKVLPALQAHCFGFKIELARGISPAHEQSGVIVYGFTEKIIQIHIAYNINIVNQYGKPVIIGKQYVLGFLYGTTGIEKSVALR